MADLRVRRYRSADAKRCCDIINDAIVLMDGINEAARTHIRMSNVPEVLDADLAQWSTVVVETNERDIVGVGALDGNEIKRVYVDPVAQGQGVARALMSTLERFAIATGLATLQLEASPSSIGFYESLGYESGRPDNFEIGDASFRFVPMTKRLE